MYRHRPQSNLWDNGYLHVSRAQSRHDVRLGQGTSHERSVINSWRFNGAVVGSKCTLGVNYSTLMYAKISAQATIIHYLKGFVIGKPVVVDSQ